MHADATAALLSIAALTAGHHIGDYWAQTNHQALTKGERGHHGRRACAGHVATLTLAQTIMLALVLGLTGTAVSLAATSLGLAVNATSHYWADRRITLGGLVLALDPITGKRSFYENTPGAHLWLDQAFHIGWIIPAALIIAAPLPLATAITGGCLALLGLADATARHGRRTQTHPA